MSGLRSCYAKLHAETLEPLALALEAHLRTCFAGVSRVDRIAARAKDVERFLAKAERLEGGKKKYVDPANQIQDQIGARVIVFYRSDVELASQVIDRYFKRIEQHDIVPESESEFGYFGKHYILHVPSDVYDGEALKPGVGPRFFELQIKTLFQHAWSEAGHDLAYKPSAELTSDQRRRVALTAAQAWGADVMFDELHEATS